MNPARVSSASVNAETGRKTTVKDGGTLEHGLEDSSRQKPQPAPSQPVESKIVRLKLTMPRPPKSKTQEVDWDEDLRPTPNELLESKQAQGRTSAADTASKHPKTVDKNKGSKRAMPPKARTTSAKRRKSNNTRKSNTAKTRRTKGLQLPLVTLAASTVPTAPLADDGSSRVENLDERSKDNATKGNKRACDVSKQPLSPTDGNGRKVKDTGNHAIVKKSSCTSVTTGSSSDLETDGKVSILQHRAQSNRQPNMGTSASVMPDVSSSSDGIFTETSRTAATSKLTIRESRALTKRGRKEAKAIHRNRHPGKRGRAESVGGKLMLALHGAEIASQQKPDNKQAELFIISSDPVPPEDSPKKQEPDQAPNSMRQSKIERELDRTMPVETHQHRAEPETVNPALLHKALSPKMQDMNRTHETNLLDSDQTKRSPTHCSSDYEIGRSLIDTGPSILDYHLEMENISGFAALQPLRSEPTTPSHVSNICESPANSSSGSPNVENLADFATSRIEERECSHTSESQKPLLRNDALIELILESPQPPKSGLKTSIVDSNGSPRLMTQSAKSMTAPRLGLKGERCDEDEASLVNASTSEYDRDLSEVSVESRYERRLWTKFQRDMFMQYGIKTTRLEKSPWPPHPMQPPSYSQRDTARKEASRETSLTNGGSSSQRTMDERALGGVPAREHGHLDQSFRTEMSATTENLQRSTTDDPDPSEWISSLQVAQKDAHNLLRQTNLHLSTQLAAEKATISRVLEIYREGCSRILDDLFQAQEARMQLYQQQMQAVKEQHADICQEMVRGLQDLDRRVQQGPI
ncbi:uncharacterized protein N7515_002038 [Penicillium bovifimosum]|uniref:Uncharacterized protein n=1 Tax=Penicillium bovifimosum TaxID=126998 RepID=A0A9W9L8Z9_9EURO|nr:uncharacterized protein N7515_002038 [Penicillium bovifimosum]KAJ5143251.1 hypothetical protein N7515_002038 [Penicillium bovifimosum]